VDRYSSADGLYCENLTEINSIATTFTAHPMGASITLVDCGGEDDIVTTIIANTMLSDNKVGIHLVDSSCTIVGNVFDANSESHIVVHDCGSRWVVIDNNDFLWRSGPSQGLKIDRSDYGNHLQVNRNDFYGHNLTNSSYAVFVSSLIPLAGGDWWFIVADDNFWGSINGPHDPGPPTGSDGDYNNNPAGDRVNDGVDYRPFATSPH